MADEKNNENRNEKPITDRELLAICNLANLKLEFANLQYSEEKLVGGVQTKKLSNHTIASMFEKEHDAIVSEESGKSIIYRLNKSKNKNGQTEEVKSPIYTDLENFKCSAGIAYEYYEKCESNSEGQFTKEWKILYAADGYKLAYDYLEYFVGDAVGEYIKTREEIEDIILGKKILNYAFKGIYYMMSIMFAHEILDGKILDYNSISGKKGISKLFPGHLNINSISQSIKNSVIRDFNASTWEQLGIDIFNAGQVNTTIILANIFDKELKKHEKNIINDKGISEKDKLINFAVNSVFIEDAIIDEIIKLVKPDPTKVELLKNLINLKNLLKTPPPKLIRADLFDFKVMIFQKDKNVVITFKDSTNGQIKKLISEGNYIDIFMYLDIIHRHVLPKALGTMKLSDFNIIITGFNTGGELANIFNFFSENFQCRPFFTNYTFYINDFISFTTRDIACFLKVEYMSMLKIIFDESLSLSIDSGVIRVATRLYLILFHTTKQILSLASFGVIALAGLGYSILFIIKRLNQKNQLELFYILLCRLGFFICNECNGQYTVNACKYCKNDGLSSYPPLISHTKLASLLNESTILRITDLNRIEIKKQIYISLLFEIFAVSETIPNDGNKWLINFWEGTKIVTDVEQESSIFNMALIKLGDNSYKTTLFKEIITTTNIKEIAEFDNILYEEAIKKKPEPLTEYDVYHNILTKNCYFILDFEEEEYQIKKIVSYGISCYHTQYLAETPIKYYEKTSKEKEEPLSELFDTFLLFLERHIAIQKNYIENKKNKFGIFCINEKNKDHYINYYNDIKQITAVKTNSKLSEFVFFPYINKEGLIKITMGDKNNSQRVTYLQINDNYIGSLLRSVMEDICRLDQKSKDPKFYSLIESKIEKYASRRKNYLEKDLYDGINYVNETAFNLTSANKNKYTTEQLITLMDYLLGSGDRSINSTQQFLTLSTYYCTDDAVKKMKEFPEIVEKFYDISMISGEGGVIKMLKIGIMNDPTDKEIAYIYNSEDYMKRGIIKIVSSVPDETTDAVNLNADKTQATSGAILKCNKSSTTSIFTATTIQSYTINGHTIGTDKDTLGITNIGAFGKCAAKNDKSCECPQTGNSNWMGSNKKVINDSNGINLTSTIKCTLGGTISFIIDGETTGSKNN
ncbi:MAG: DUF4280 domain-containing protein [Fusobacteriaceae bacterium]|jgi:hypothetical protein|nr:DUF4280 domain-containing protein [Fusobacteriaceae bacterium]